ncbi:hypothetical protein AKJ37_04130 [candidate division MSBL1 archaeon SCGC-AAA259I09]|uniref:Thiamine pyrophosphate enzyme TPP-binding domain-containing protein n=1 Tax=candidate division MSBL1 archaeon SCGC-AAA259I09 TaxID=1698267 RepID=A0A133URQ4_9EURY|nr:hypothetical protein AKJ37_04130 [candidate division MSBL1 archaeon SCGC-AAA259I09]
MSWKDLPSRELLLRGNASCAGCGSTLALRWVLKVLGEKIVLIIPAGCGGVYQGIFPQSSINVMTINSSFGSQASLMSGLRAAFDVKDREGTIVCWAGDGATADIGLNALSSAAERNEDLIYLCYDNEAYMNTGVQRSSLTPLGAKTTTTPKGKVEFKKNMPLIMADHEIPYVATVSVGYPDDFTKKLEKAKEMEGFRYIHILSPCPPGWEYESDKTVEVSRLAVKSGAWPLYEVEGGITGGKLEINRAGGDVSLKEYLDSQGRFEGLSNEKIKRFEKQVQDQLEYLKLLENRHAGD